MDDICGYGVCLDCWLSVRRPIWPTTSQLAPNGPVQPCLAEHCFSCRFDVYVLCFLLCCFGVINNNNKHTHTSSTHLPYRHVVRGMRWPLSSHKRLAGVLPLSRKTPGRQHSNAFPWLSKEEMRFHSTTPWSQSKLPLQP